MRIYYGVENNYVDITHLALTRCVVGNNSIVIPIGDQQRCKLFGDPCFNILKHIKVVDSDNSIKLYNDKVVATLTTNTVKLKVPPVFEF